MVGAAAEVVLDRCDAARAMRDLEVVSGFDRYQASLGIERAAEYVVGQVERAGLHDVRLTYPDDGPWWTWAAPVPWTPRSASLAVGGRVLTTYPRDGFCVATHCADARPQTCALTILDERAGHDDLRDSLCIVPGNHLPARAIGRLEVAGARGLVACARPDGADGVGRIELAPGSPLVAFSVSHKVLRTLLDAARVRATARYHVDSSATGRMPLVSGLVRAAAPGPPSLVVAHLCHPRPSANDNASGVAATLELARVLAGMASDGCRFGDVRFLWGPEFVGMASHLHDTVTADGSLPRYVVNLDMVGQDVAASGEPLVLEGAADHAAGALDAAAALAARAVAKRSPGWTWRSSQFVGTSDHMLAADRCFAIPTLRLGAADDPCNHSSLDDAARLSQADLGRAAAVAGGALLALTVPGESRGLAREVVEMGAAGVAEAVRRCAAGRGADLIDPFSAQRLPRFVRHLRARTRRALSDPALTGRARPRAPAAAWVREDALVRRWPGPFNVRALLDDLETSDAAWLRGALASRRSGYARVVALAFAIDDANLAADVVERAAFALREPIDSAFGLRCLDLLRGTGWAEDRATPAAGNSA